MENNNYEYEFIQLGNIIRHLRLEKGITQEYLSSLCDVDIRTIQRIEKGKQNLSLKLLFSISNSLNTKPDLLINKIFENIDNKK